MNVVDIGCYWHPDHQGESQDSIAQLIERFKPETVEGYDPQLRGLELARSWIGRRWIGAVVILHPYAVWTNEGLVPWLGGSSGLSSKIGTQESVPCVDIALVVGSAGKGCVVKIDAEGAEYELLKRLHETGTDKLISLLLVEWHGEPRPELVDCPVEVWE